MKVLIDSNVVLDVILKNAVLITTSKVILDSAEQKHFIGYISASAITDIFYVTKKRLGKEVAKEAVKELLNIFYPATVTDKHIYQALDLDWGDFEDSVQYIVGESISVNYIVTRNTKDFTTSSIPTVTPEKFMQIITDLEKKATENTNTAE